MQFISTLNEVDVGRLTNEMWRSYSIGSTICYFIHDIHEDLPGCPARKSGEEWQLVAKRR